FNHDASTARFRHMDLVRYKEVNRSFLSCFATSRTRSSPLGPAFPALCPARVLLSRVSPGPFPWLRRLRPWLPRFVRRHLRSYEADVVKSLMCFFLISSLSSLVFAFRRWASGASEQLLDAKKPLLPPNLH